MWSVGEQDGSVAKASFLVGKVLGLVLSLGEMGNTDYISPMNMAKGILYDDLFIVATHLSCDPTEFQLGHTAAVFYQCQALSPSLDFPGHVETFKMAFLFIDTLLCLQKNSFLFKLLFTNAHRGSSLHRKIASFTDILVSLPASIISLQLLFVLCYFLID